MSQIPLNIGTIHFVGIGGIGMSGIAEVLHTLGYSVRGSDSSNSAIVERLQEMGISVQIGQKSEHVAGASVVVVSSAILENNPEMLEARKRHIPVVRRAEMLAEIMRLREGIAIGGTHGKTTTTSLVAQVLDGGDMDPTVINGGIINAYGTNARLGTGQWLVAEADESDGTMVKLPATIAVVTNLDPEHMEHYGTFDNLKQAFRTFIENIPFYGFAVACIDHPEVQKLISTIQDRRVITYGFSPQASVRATKLRTDSHGSTFNVTFTRLSGEVVKIKDIFLPMHGKHNVSNSLVAICIGLRLNIAPDVIKDSLAKFAGVKRRFTKTGTVNGVTIIDDYGHHPVEIQAVLKSAREAQAKRIVAVMQPHRYTRLHDLFDDFCASFNDADKVIITPVHAAGEDPIKGIDHAALAEGLSRYGHKDVTIINTEEELTPIIASIIKEDQIQKGDMVICLGAGTITKWANALPENLKTTLSQ